MELVSAHDDRFFVGPFDDGSLRLTGSGCGCWFVLDGLVSLEGESIVGAAIFIAAISAAVLTHPEASLYLTTCGDEYWYYSQDLFFLSKSIQ